MTWIVITCIFFLLFFYFSFATFFLERCYRLNKNQAIFHSSSFCKKIIVAIEGLVKPSDCYCFVASLTVLATVHLFRSVLVWQNDTTSYFSVSLKFGACYIMGQWGEFKILLYCYHLLFWHFFVVFHHKICVFIIFTFFDKVSNFCNRILTNQKQEFACWEFRCNILMGLRLRLRNCAAWKLVFP